MSERCCDEIITLHAKYEALEEAMKANVAAAEKREGVYKWVIGGMGAACLTAFLIIINSTWSIQSSVTCIRADLQTITARFEDHLEKGK